MGSGVPNAQTGERARGAAFAYLIAVPLLAGTGALLAWGSWREHVGEMPGLCQAHDAHGNCLVTFPTWQLVPWFAVAVLAAALASRTIGRSLRRSDARTGASVAIAGGVALVSALAILPTARMTLPSLLVAYSSFSVLAASASGLPFGARSRKVRTTVLLMSLPPALFVGTVLLFRVLA